VQLHEHGDSQQAAQQQAEPGEQAAAQVHRCPLGVMNAGVDAGFVPASAEPGNFSRKAGKGSRDSCCAAFINWLRPLGFDRPARKTLSRRQGHMKKMTFPRPALLAALVAATCCSSAHAGKTVSWEDLLNDDKTPQDVLSYGLGLKAQRHSTLAKVNTRNVANLVPAWSFSFGGEKQRGQEGQALVHDGVIYATSSYSRIFAIDARSGKRLWEYEARLPDDIRPCCDVVNRGPAIYGDKIFFGTLDASIVALNKDTGKVVWKKKFGDHKIGYTMTGAPSW
jgi:glucose dehydrogenase